MVGSERAKPQFSRNPNREHRRMRHRTDLPAPTPAKARKIWESMANPSTRRVATRLRQAGLSVSHMQVARWRNQGWRPVAQKDHPLEAARKSLDDAMPLLTGNPSTTANVFLEKKTAEREALEQLTDKELLNQAVREIATTAIISCALRQRVNTLIPTKAGELAVLLRSLAMSLSAVAAGFRQAAYMRPQNSEREDLRR
jgi:hypothetical protein